MPRLAFRLLLVTFLVFPPVWSYAAPLRLTLPPQTQAQAGSPDDQAWAMLRGITPGTRLVVGRPMGAVAGSFAGVDAESITLTNAGYEGPRVVVPRSEVTTVLGPPHRNVGPHLARGVAIGGLVGALAGVGVGQSLGNDHGVAVVMLGAFGAGVGLGVGALNGLGGERRSDVLYRRPGSERR